MRQFEESNFLRFFVQHRTSANIIMIIMIVVGVLSIGRLNKQFFPDFDVDLIAVSIDWPGATAEEIDQNIIQLLEPELRPISGVKRFTQNQLKVLGLQELSLSMAKIFKKQERILKQRYRELIFLRTQTNPK